MAAQNLCGYAVEIDKDATASWYNAADNWGCDCGHCRNFLQLAEEKKLPTHIMQILAELEIPPAKATYVCELYTDEQGILYQFSYRLAGTILQAPNQANVDDGRCCHETYPYGAPNFPEPHFDLEFCTRLPWVLAEPQNGTP